MAQQGGFTPCEAAQCLQSSVHGLGQRVRRSPTRSGRFVLSDLCLAAVAQVHTFAHGKPHSFDARRSIFAMFAQSRGQRVKILGVRASLEPWTMFPGRCASAPPVCGL